ncbi:3-oxo-5-alpha-steroid 4-dehydrogenase-like protein [Lophiostoma macrostomum CBS 122681]|uniref:Polyprenal reductase n=1 Tax=Lophiostoma macrostomum CBS 122681 TaxID=1314788 RepID=A0A6A6T0V6_9PLEO|nr:3-oxo-5-alpha-steroid 4-dehydrogenase-like protein [Lophiostoma macrostomum CBS 122681]
MLVLLAPAVLRAFYLGSSALAVPALQSRFLDYGSRATAPPSGQHHGAARDASPLGQTLDSLARVRVPHNYFTHFYVLSVLCSAYWGWHLWRTAGFSMLHVSWTARQVQVAWLLMLLQGVRRLLESYAYTSTSTSGMWFGHWILGLLFYLATNVAIWVEGASSLTGRDRLDGAAFEQEEGFQWKLAVLPPAILTCHALQHSYHAYLYRLRTEHSTYQLPSHPMFPNLLCPHYTCETIIYLLLSFLAAPDGRFVNWTLASATVFVGVNLGVTAVGTKAWYEQRFGVDKVKQRRRMVPCVW